MNNFILAGSWRWSTALSINIDPVVYWLQRGGYESSTKMSNSDARVCTMSGNEPDAELPICICCSCEQNSDIERNQARTMGKTYACPRHPQMRIVSLPTRGFVTLQLAN